MEATESGCSLERIGVPVTDLLFAALMLTAAGCVLWAATWLRNYVMRQYRIVKR